MKKRMLTAMGMAILAVSAFALAGCEEILKTMFSASGKVVNVKASSTATDQLASKTNSSVTLSGATITFTDGAGAKFTGTVSSSGSYEVKGLGPGKYQITGAKDGWTFVPTSFVMNGFVSTGPTILAFPTSEAGSLTVVMSWEKSSQDMDLHMTWGTLASAGSTNTNHLFYGSSSKAVSGTNFTATLDRDVVGTDAASIQRVETITLTASGGAISPNNGGSLPATNDAAMDAVNNSFRFYVDSYGTASGTTGLTGTGAVAPAYVTLNFFQGTSHIGSYYAPYNTAERTLRVARVLFDGTSSNNYLVYTDTESASSGIFRGTDEAQIGVDVDSIQ